MVRMFNYAGPNGEKRPAPYIPPALPDDEEHIFATLQKGINFDNYDKIPVECTGSNAPRNGILRYEYFSLLLNSHFKLCLAEVFCYRYLSFYANLFTCLHI